MQRPIKVVASSAALREKGNYRHFMEKEIHDQPDACQHTLSAYLDPIAGVAAALANPQRRLRRLLLTEEAEAALTQMLAPPWPLPQTPPAAS